MGCLYYYFSFIIAVFFVADLSRFLGFAFMCTVSHIMTLFWLCGVQKFLWRNTMFFFFFSQDCTTRSSYHQAPHVPKIRYPPLSPLSEFKKSLNGIYFFGYFPYVNACVCVCVCVWGAVSPQYQVLGRNEVT
ncbi:hypothetical protein K440DRAFT_258938 [Wilcoxina mikolae CBS 423.85]|nr:hypothetical protein K440DRAFT_258938 [Wilcoxina mikolae CBS 423.85]